MICKKCNTVFHYCGSCGEEFYLEAGFCSDKCLLESKEFIEAKANAQAFRKSLTEKQVSQFEKFMCDEAKFLYRFP